MEQYTKKIEVRWADLDPNFHMLHSKYYDLGAYCRMSYLVEYGITPAFLKQNHIGPIIFREECIFKREINFGDEISINVKMQKVNHDASRWTMVHEIWKNGDTLAALITCDGAWMDTKLRKLAIPGKEIFKVFEEAPRTNDFIMQAKEEDKK
ncbi:MAG: acyl-CoA thioesterase [Ferruginibacter sp.]